MMSIIRCMFSKSSGYFKVKLSNREILLLTRKEFSDLKIKDIHKSTLFESTSGNFYKPFTKEDDEVYFKLS